MKKSYSSKYLILPILAISLSILACAGRTFAETRVYTSEGGSTADYYDVSENRIIGENVWVFRSDGTFEANLVIEQERINFSGQYEGDDVGDIGFFMFLNTDSDERFDDGEVLLDTENDEYNWIEWVQNDVTYRYYITSD